MSKVVIVGGSIAALAAALALAGQGRRVTVLERGAPPPDGPPGDAGQAWPRPLVPSWPHAHTLTSLGVSVLLDRAPQVIASALDVGAVMVDLTRAKPGAAGRPANDTSPGLARTGDVTVPPGEEPGDAELLALACRRPTLEMVLYRIVRELPGVEIRHGTRVQALSLSGDRVTGVRTDRGERIPAELVLDATGRRAQARSWLADRGRTLPPDLTSPSKMRIFSRFYRRLGQTAALNRGNAAGVLGDHYASVLHPGDSGTFSVALGVLPEDHAMRALRDPEAFTAVAMATPGVADWLAPGMSTPITDVRAITCAPNMVRRMAIASPVTGLLPIGDAAAITNPLYGRGVSLSIAHAFRLADLLATTDDGPAQRDAATRLVSDLVLPWFRLAGVDDAERIDHWRASAAGVAPPPRPQALTMRGVARVADRDALVWRGLLRVLMGLSHPDTILNDSAFEHRVRGLLDQPALPCQGPSRADLLAAVARGIGRAA